MGTWEWDIPSGKVTINERWAEMLGYTLKELEPFSFEGFQKLLYPKDAASIIEKVAACFEKKTDFYEGEFRFLHKKGFIVWVHDLGKVVNWAADGQPLLMAGTHTNITKRKNTEIQFQTITNNIPGAVFRFKRYLDGKDELQLLSNGAKNLWGFSAQEVMQNSSLVWKRFESNDLDAFLLSIQKSAEDLSFWENEWPYYHPNGKKCWHKGSGSPFRLEDGSTIWDGVILDITLQKENGLKIRQSEKRFKGLVQNSSDLIAILDFEANLKYVSPASTKILGITPEKFIVKNGFDIIHPDDKEAVYASLLKLKNEKQLTLKPFRIKHGDGSWRWIETIVTNLLDDPAVGGLVANSRDITDRIEHEKDLKESEQRYSDLFHLSPQPMWVYDMATLKFLDVNKAAIEHYGYSYEEFLNMTIREIRPQSEIPKLEVAIKQLIQKEKNYSRSEYLYKKKNGQEIIVEIQSNVLSYQGKKAEIILATDITERYNHIKDIEAKNEKLKEIAWTQSHIVRAPLARIMGLVELLKLDTTLVDEKEREQLLKHILSSAIELDEVIKYIVHTSQQDEV